jgi:hypothetical protein
MLDLGHLVANVYQLREDVSFYLHIDNVHYVSEYRN